ncbi:MAG: 4Fe-4S dicluster domain-containing protein [Clostridia bacterium]|jgi:heterodisulfide reductase subunit C|nr:4Fe-4S dicluster domain-containing protein [Clostridia bacterium]
MNKKTELLKEQIVRMSGVNTRKCMKCGKCSATCPSYDEMEYHPHQFVYMVENGDIEELMNSKSIYKCLSCFACVDRCPRSVEPAKLVEAVRSAVIRQQGANHLKPDDIPALLDEEMPQQAIVSALRKYSK